MRDVLLVCLLSTVALTSACGSGGSSGDQPDAPPGGSGERFLPWTVGSVWNYKLTDPKNPGSPKLNQPTTILRMQDVGGVHAGTQAMVVHHVQYSGSKDVYEAAVGDLDVRYQTSFFDAQGTPTGTDVDQPYRLKLDESAAHTVTGVQWSTSFTETSSGAAATTKNESWSVVASDEPITVIAGSFTALHIRRTSSGGSLQDYWYVRGVGKVKETGGGQDEELMSFTIAP
jgi:hypothetical protein